MFDDIELTEYQTELDESTIEYPIEPGYPDIHW